MVVWAAISLVVSGCALSIVVYSLDTRAYVGVAAAGAAAVLCSALALNAGMVIRATRDTWIEIGEGGFRLSRAGVLITARWEEVESLWERNRYVPWRRHALRQTFHLTLVSGQTVRIDHIFDQMRELGVHLQRLTTTALLPGALATYERGEPVHFGRIGVTQWGISNGQQRLLWRDLRYIGFERGILTVIRSDRQRPWERPLWERVSMAQIPNIYLLTTLINKVPRA